MKVTNNSAALQGVHTLYGVVYLSPGDTKELEISEGDAAQLAKLDFLTLKGDPSKQIVSAGLPSIDIPPNEIDQLRQQVTDLQAEVKLLNDLLAERDDEESAGAGDDKSGLVGPFDVRETSPGWYGIFQSDQQIGKSVRASEADAFKAMSAEDQIAHLTPKPEN